jgi:LysR family transcriptional regulator for bpeEF and oprC
MQNFEKLNNPPMLECYRFRQGQLVGWSGMDRLDALKVFCAVVEAGGFSKAASKLGISTSSVTNQVSALEDHFKIKLLHRTTRSMSLTDEGRLCYDNAQRILGDVGDMEDLLRHSNHTPKGLLRVDMPGIVSRLFVMPALPGFLDQYPDMTLRMSGVDKFVDMVEEGIDVMIRIGDLPNSNLIATVLAQTHYVTCASPDFLKRHGQPATPDELPRYPCLSFLYPKSRQVRPWAFQNAGQGQSHVPQALLATDHVESLIEAAVAGCGIIQVLSISVMEQLRSGTLVAILADWTAPGPNVSALYPQRHLRAAKVKVFVDFLASVFRPYRTE